MDAFFWKDNQFSLKVWSMAGWSQSSGWPHTHEYMAAQIVIRNLLKKERGAKIVRNNECVEWIWESFEKAIRDSYGQNIS